MVKAKKQYVFDPDFAVPPGESIAETIETLGMNQKELATRTGLTEQSIYRIIKGTQPITFETANKLELATGVPASMWNNLEAIYREQLSKFEEQARLAEELGWLKKIPIKELVKRQVIPAEKDKTITLRHALAFYGVSSVDAWENTYCEKLAVAARRSQKIETHLGPTSAWLRLGELQAQNNECEPYDKSRFEESLQKIRSLTTKAPDVFVRRMKELCANAGVALCLVPEIPGAPFSGVTKWITPTKAMILLSLRGRRDDKFWFSFFHEAGHILNDSKKEMFLNDDSDNGPSEKRADDFAATFLIPSDRQQEILDLQSKDEVIAFAKDLGIAPGIVVGQFQFMTKKWTFFNDLKTTLVWDSDDYIPYP